MLQKMLKLKSMDINIVLLTNDMHIHQLDKITATVETDLHELDFLIAAHSMLNIKSVNLVCGFYHDIADKDTFISTFIRASSIFTQLVEINMEYTFIQPNTLIRFVACLPQPITLTLEFVNYDKSTRYSLIESIPAAFQSLSLTLSTSKDTTSSSVNVTFQFLLISCPLLERFKIRQMDGDDIPIGGIYLDFRNNTHLKYLEVQAIYEQYFKFEHIPAKKGKRWSNFDSEVDEER